MVEVGHASVPLLELQGLSAVQKALQGGGRLSESALQQVDVIVVVVVGEGAAGGCELACDELIVMCV